MRLIGGERMEKPVDSGKFFSESGHFKKVWNKLLNFPGQWVIIGELK
jgi:hypothetical protein